MNEEVVTSVINKIWSSAGHDHDMKSAIIRFVEIPVMSCFVLKTVYSRSTCFGNINILPPERVMACIMNSDFTDQN